MKDSNFMLSTDNRDKYPISQIKKAKRGHYFYHIDCSSLGFIKIKTGKGFFSGWKTYVTCLWPEEIQIIWDRLNTEISNN